MSAVTYILFSQISPISSKFTQICSRFVLALTVSGRMHKVVADADGHHQPSPKYGDFSGCVLLQYM